MHGMLRPVNMQQVIKQHGPPAVDLCTLHSSSSTASEEPAGPRSGAAVLPLNPANNLALYNHMDHSIIW